jgi:hypothetical protein
MNVEIAAGVVVRNIAPTQKVEVVGFRIGLFVTPTQEPLTLTNNSGSVRIVSCVVNALVYEYPVNCRPAYDAINASQSQDVTLVGCLVQGGMFLYDYQCGLDGAAALVADQCSFAVLDSILSGGQGGDDSHGPGGNGGPAAILSGSSTMLACRSDFWRSSGGGSGCSTTCDLGYCSFPPYRFCRPARDGDGVVLVDSSWMTWKDSTFGSIVPTSSAQEVSIAPYCLGTFRECPCGNQGAGTAGCEHPFGSTGARLDGVGNASVASDTVTLQVTGLNPNASPTVLLLQGSNRNTGSPFADGFHCTGGTILRIYGKPSASGQAAFGFGQVGEVLSAAGQVPPAGGARFYQVWYRNEDAAFCTASHSNLSNGVEVAWGP